MNEELFRNYYKNFFPLNDIKMWISYSGKESLENREVAFWFSEESFMRWQTIKQMDTLINSPTVTPPQRMEIGPIFTYPLSERQTCPSGTFYPKKRELVFDIDINDFQEVRTCCEGAKICPKCWKFMSCAMKCLNKIFRDNFGFKDILTVFSGRRGVHFWICDSKAISLESKVRKSIVQYLNIIELLDSNKISNPTPLISDIFSDCEEYFMNYIYEEQNIFYDSKLKQKIISIIDKDHYDGISKKLLTLKGNSYDKWKVIKELAFSNSKKKFQEKSMYKKLILTFTFPRLDSNVTIGLNHLLKTPFSIHPGTGLISVPIPYHLYDSFPNEWVPEINSLLKGEISSIETFEKSIKIFQDFYQKIDK